MRIQSNTFRILTSPPLRVRFEVQSEVMRVLGLDVDRLSSCEVGHSNVRELVVDGLSMAVNHARYSAAPLLAAASNSWRAES
jgi:hypothetical protein